eukprot:CAMPEP_0171497536 /NCGR_PEP_ID=MMETSP0958-20121227/7331_1 /TAXON_ID=87120 /ORGANISM="Aurantiochytrium limacinum, Strain ATCCMYA-1381" /LENGTH=543 /DNA_ID=CAMNT_0012031799 /DNA_START=1011 /DNA_END=2642 /DNA_ORIENTATION=+
MPEDQAGVSVTDASEVNKQKSTPSKADMEKMVEEYGEKWFTRTLSRLAFFVVSAAVLVGAVAVGMSKDLQEDIRDLTRDMPLPVSSNQPLPQNAARKYPVSFTVHFNGDGLSEGMPSTSTEWLGIDPLIRMACEDLDEVYELARADNATLAEICEPTLGARLFTHGGKRIFSFEDVPANGTRLYIVPRGLQFVYPLAEVGDVIIAENVQSPIPGRQVTLKQLTKSPRVFTIENFVSDEEINAILEHNMDLLKPSEVGFSGWRDRTRTSSTAWDFHSWAARKVRRRSFDLLGMDFDNEMADALQVLRYNLSEWYKPHLDSFDKAAYDQYNPRVENGTNRFATVFLYLSDVEEGGHTVFPLSTTHEGYNGEQIVHDGTVKTPGYIAERDARWACNTSSTALRSPTRRGTAVLFYSQTEDGAIDPYSLHGGCPVIKGMKFSANVWVWNRPKPNKDQAKDSERPAPDHNSIQMQFHNHRDNAVNLFWDDGTDEMLFQVEIPAGEMQSMTTYNGHSFVAKDAFTNQTVHRFTARNLDHKGRNHVEDIV